MRIIDLTHSITEDMPVYPGTAQPSLKQANSLQKDGYQEILLSLTSHTGTHIDAPSHLYEGKHSLDEIPLHAFFGTATIVDCLHLGQDAAIGMDVIRQNQKEVDAAEFVLFRTDWDQYWGTADYYCGYPIISRAVLQYLADTGKKGVGVDTLSIDAIQALNLPNHHFLLQHDILPIENLTHLSQVGPGLFYFCALPLKFANADGAPVRAIAIFD